MVFDKEITHSLQAMTKPLSDALQPYQGNYETLFTPGQMLEYGKKGWGISRKPVRTKDIPAYTEKLVSDLTRTSFENVVNPERLVARINTFAHKAPKFPSSKRILFKSRCEAFGFLSNFFPSLIFENAKVFRSSEHLYQWRVVISLTNNEDTANHYGNIRDLEALQARKYSHTVQGSSGEEVDSNTKLEIMRDVALQKFTQNPPLRDGLIATLPATLVENTESDFWGGENNHMGNILETVRSSFFTPQEDRKTSSEKE